MTDPVPIEFRRQTPEKTRAHLDHERLMDCIHCGLCLSQCPTYVELGLEADSPRGRIYLMRTLAEGRSEVTPGIAEHLDLCLGCRACETACPSGVQYGHLIEGARAFVRENYERPRKEQIIGQLVESIFPYPNRLEAALLPIRVLRRSGAMALLRKSGAIKAFGYLGDLERLLPKLPPLQRRLRFPERWSARGTKQASVAMITGCVMQVLQSHVNAATARLLCKAGCDVSAPKEQGCCGALHAHCGAIEKARELAKKNIEVFEEWQRTRGELDAIIINAAGCGAALKEYPGWFKGDVEWEERARAFSAKVKDVSEFLAQPPYKARLAALVQSPKFTVQSSQSVAARDVLPNTTGATTLKGLHQDVEESSENEQLAIEPSRATTANVAAHHSPLTTHQITYHDACHLAHGQGVRAQPRELLAMIPGIEIVPLLESEMCCGSAGTYNIVQPEMAMRLLERKMKNIADSGAPIVVTGNPGCLMQLLLGAQKFNVPVVIKHPVELLDEATD